LTVRPRTTYANVTSTVALVLALGGTAYAGVTLGRGAVKGVNLAPNSVTSPKVKDHSLLARDFAPGQLAAGLRGPAGSPGLQGSQGPAGPQGAPGTARAYATVTSTGALVAARSRGVAGVSKPAGAAVGSYCISLAAGIDASSVSPVANADLADPASSSKDYAQVDTAGADCGGKLEVITRHLSIDSTTTPVSIAAHRSDEGFTLVVP
jgi:hypothetical protein